MNYLPVLLASALSLIAAPALAQPVVKIATIDEGGLGGFRDRLQSALLESGVIRLSTISGNRDVPVPAYIVTGKVGATTRAASVTSASDYCVGGTKLAVSLDLRVRDARGQVVFGGLVDASATVGSDIATGGGSCSSMTPFSPSLRGLGNALALAAARRIAFTLEPLRVARVEGREIVLNRGGTLLPLGALIQIAGVSGGAERYRIISITPGSATAEPVGLAANIAVGAIARVLEDGDAQANARRFRKVELP